MILAYLLLGHLLGDFVFQPTILIRWKMRSKWGILFHVFIHFVLKSLILLPLILNGYFWLLYVVIFLCIFHFFVDSAKISYDQKSQKKTKAFVIDQLLHLLSIIIAYILISDVEFRLPDTVFNHYYTNIRIIMGLALVIFLSIVIDIFHYQKIREKDQKAQYIAYPSGMLRRVLIFLALFSAFILLVYLTLGKTL